MSKSMDKNKLQALPNGDKVQSVFATDDHSFVLTTQGALYASGNDDFGQLGLGHEKDVDHWTHVELPKGVTVQSVVVGAYRSFILTTEGKLYAYGANKYSKLGFGPIDYTYEWTPVPSIGVCRVLP